MSLYWTGIRTYLRLRRNLKVPLEVLQKRQWADLQALIALAYERVPLYRQLYDAAGFQPRDLRQPEDLGRIPKTNKSLFQTASAGEFLARGCAVDQLIKKRTSGSSGSPLNIYYASEDRIYRTALHLRILFANGMKARDRMAHISDSRHAVDWRYGFQKLGFLSKDFVYAADSAENQLAELTRIQPDVIYGYASSLALLAALIEDQGMKPLKPKLIFTTGELLSDEDRQRINRAFSTNLRDIYGVVEMGDVAWQCAAGSGYHLNIDSFFAEIVDDHGDAVRPGLPGRLVITNLHSRAMPFIRYEIGDVVAGLQMDSCACGCTFPKIQMVQGRADDWLYAADGRRVSPLVFVVASIPGVQQYRMIQKTRDSLDVEILPGKEFSPLTLRKAEAHVREVLGAEMRVEARAVTAIPKDPSGKMRRVISQIAS